MTPLYLLSDVPGVLAAYFVAADGRVAFRLPSAQISLADEIVVQTASRLQGILSSAGTAVPGAQHLLLKHTKGVLHANQIAEGLLLVFVARTTALATLRAAVNMLLPQLAQACRAAPLPERAPPAPAFSVPSLAEVRPPTPPPAPPPAPTPAAPAAPAAAPAPKKAPQKTRTGIWG